MVAARKILLFLTAAQVLLGCGREVRPAAAVSGTQLRLLVGTYTEGTSAQGVYLYSYDPATAQTQLLSVAPSGNPSFVITSPDGSRAWSVNEFNDGRQGVSTYVIGSDPARTPAGMNTLTLLGQVPLPKSVISGEDPCNLLCTGDALISSNYSGGTLAAFRLDDKGGIDSLSQVFAYQEDGPPAHMHCATLSPDGKYVFATDLGRDRILRPGRPAATRGGHGIAIIRKIMYFYLSLKRATICDTSNSIC